MAEDGMLPKVFGKLHAKSRSPWVAILALAVGWGLALNLGFERLVTLDIMIYGASLTLEFVALVFLRIREPGIETPVPRAGWAVWSDCGWHSSDFAAGICHRPQRTRSCARHELALVWTDWDRCRRSRLLDQPCAEADGLGTGRAQAGTCELGP